ncbi:hypothetical protein [Halomonas sp. PR-M31]|uniref:hypothetical protein n=1 Tax=Halomonas sp. PR-M31 TaxID=1471202 RepID=UPI00209E1FA0|nr:hypothetical protein [Halomonas sp. PR-M31]
MNIVVPIALILVLAGAIFGGQAVSESRADNRIQQALATALESSNAIELKFLQQVNHGYGVCGLYKVASSNQGYASFFYDKVNETVILDVNSRRYTSNCGLSAFC